MNSRRLLLLLVAAFMLPAARARADSPALEAAIDLFKAKRVPEAREQLATIVAREPQNITALWYLGQAELKTQHREAAVTTLAKAVDLDPKNHQLLACYGNACLLRATELGVSLSSIGFAHRGRDALEQAVKLAPDVVGYREGLVQFYTRAPALAGGSLSRAYAHIDEITRINPARGAVIKANVLCSEKRYDEALSVCQEILRNQPDTYLALYTLGRIASETGRELVPGEAALRRCLQLTPRAEEPDHAGAYYRLGLIAEKDNRPADARQAYQAALAEEPSLAKASEALARLK